MAKKREKANFHEIRYRKTERHSKIFEQHEKAAQEAREAELDEHFKCLYPIKYSYELVTGIIGRWLATLSKEEDKVATYNLAEAFLLETVISSCYLFPRTRRGRSCACPFTDDEAHQARFRSTRVDSL